MRDWLLSDAATTEMLAALAPGMTPEMAAAVSKIMRLQDLIMVAAKCRVVTRFRNTLGLPGRLSVRLQPNHPTDDLRGIAASVLDGLLLRLRRRGDRHQSGDRQRRTRARAAGVLDDVRQALDIPTQSCVLAHVTTTARADASEARRSISCFSRSPAREPANRASASTSRCCDEARDAALALQRGVVGDNVMYFETGQGSALSAERITASISRRWRRAPTRVARAFKPLLVNTVVGFIGPEYLYDGKQIIRAGLEDHFCGKLLGLPMGCDVCYTNHAEADQDDMDALLGLLVAAGGTYVMGVPGDNPLSENPGLIAISMH